MGIMGELTLLHYEYEGFIYKAAEFLLFSWLGLAALITWYTQMRFFCLG